MNKPPTEPRASAPGQPGCGTAAGAPSLYVAKGVTMSQVALNLGGMMRRTVVNRTGLEGRFDVTLRASLESGTQADQPPLIFTAVQEQLGLKLQRERGPIDTFVVEHAELPTPD